MPANLRTISMSQRQTIADQVAKIDAADALDLMWRFMELAEVSV